MVLLCLAGRKGVLGRDVSEVECCLPRIMAGIAPVAMSRLRWLSREKGLLA